MSDSKGHAEDFLDGGFTHERLSQPILEHRFHAFSDRCRADKRCGLPLHDQISNLLIDFEDLKQTDPADEPASLALGTAFPFVEPDPCQSIVCLAQDALPLQHCNRFGEVRPRLDGFENSGAGSHAFAAVLTGPAYEPLGYHKGEG